MNKKQGRDLDLCEGKWEFLYMTLPFSAEDPKPGNHPVSQELFLSFPKYRKATCGEHFTDLQMVRKHPVI